MRTLYNLLFFVAAILWSAGDGVGGEWTSGGFSFSDELGGFEIRSVSGAGTRDDPIVVVQYFHNTEPVTLVIRTLGKPDAKGNLKAQSFVQFSLVTVVTNVSKKNWAGFDLELQEEQGKPSVYVDGLSFDQLNTFGDRVFTSDRFSRFSDLIEPFDRIRFENGAVNPNDTVRFQVFITDVTPVKVFYLLQDPQILMAERPTTGGVKFARLEPDRPGP